MNLPRRNQQYDVNSIGGESGEDWLIGVCNEQQFNDVRASVGSFSVFTEQLEVTVKIVF